jgi:hypothetical protein
LGILFSSILCTCPNYIPIHLNQQSTVFPVPSSHLTNWIIRPLLHSVQYLSRLISNAVSSILRLRLH